jgi:hypothetical protein
MGVDEGWCQQAVLGVDGLAGLGLQMRLDRFDASGLHAYIDAASAVGEGGVAHDQVEHGPGSLLLLALPISQQGKGHTSGKKIASSTPVEGRPCRWRD